MRKEHADKCSDKKEEYWFSLLYTATDDSLVRRYEVQALLRKCGEKKQEIKHVMPGR